MVRSFLNALDGETVATTLGFAYILAPDSEQTFITQAKEAGECPDTHHGLPGGT